jgi:hypothetical protein
MYLIPFWSETLLPLWWALKNKKFQRSDTYINSKLTLEKTVQEGDEIGWNALVAFVNENSRVIDEIANVNLIHSLFFVKDYARKKREWGDTKGKGFEDSNLDVMDTDLAVLAPNYWITYLHKAGQYTWKTKNTDA